MADPATGNVLRPPGASSVAEYTPTEILASYARFTQKGVTILKGENLKAGTALGRVTASKKYVAYDEDGADDGREVCRGILRQDVDATDEDKLANIVVSGILKNSVLVGVDGGAITDLNAREDTVQDLFIF